MLESQRGQVEPSEIWKASKPVRTRPFALSRRLERRSGSGADSREHPSRVQPAPLSSLRTDCLAATLDPLCRQTNQPPGPECYRCTDGTRHCASRALTIPNVIHTVLYPGTGLFHSQLNDLLCGTRPAAVDSILIIDCRFPYEYEGGHIKGAQNLYRPEDVERYFYPNGLQGAPLASVPRGSQVIVFHCEFSSKRGPRMCRHLRNLDRKANSDSYPQLHFPQLYLLELGYKEFFSRHRVRRPAAAISSSHRTTFVADVTVLAAIAQRLTPCFVRSTPSPRHTSQCWTTLKSARNTCPICIGENRNPNHTTI